jgi:hypothetical protein
MFKRVLRVCGAGLLVASMAIGLACPAQAAQKAAAKRVGGDLSGLWTLTGYIPTQVAARKRIPMTIEGTPPPFLPAAAELYEKRLKASDDGEPFAVLSNFCLPNGMPAAMTADAAYPIQVLQTPGQVSILFELFRTFRVIRLDAKHPADPDPNIFGDSIGHWEGQTLVVDTVGISDRTSLDMTGMPHSDALHVIERIRRVDDKTLEDLITIDDPKIYSKAWTMRMVYKKSNTPIAEFLCENQRNAPTESGVPSFSAK